MCKSGVWCHFSGVDANYTTSLDYDQFVGGRTILATQFVDEPWGRDIVHAQKYGSLSLSLSFHEPLPESIYLYILGVYSDYLEVNRQSTVVLSYSPGMFG